LNIKGKKVLVTGGAGFIGSHTVDALIENGADVVIVDNLSTGKKENLNPKATFYNVNIADPEIENILEKEKPQIIYHFAFYVLVPKSVLNPLLDMDSIAGTIRILNKVKDLNIEKFVFASSGFLYGNTPKLPAKETHPIEPISPYIVSKSTVENYLKFYKNAYNLPYIVLRYPAVYGPRQITGAMSDYIRKLAKNQQAEMWGDGTKTRDYLFIKDVVKANLQCLSIDNNHPNPVFNLGTGKETSLNFLYNKIASVLKKEPKPIYHEDRIGEQLRYCLDNSKLKKEIQWKPDYSFDEGLPFTIEFAKNKNFEI